MNRQKSFECAHLEPEQWNERIVSYPSIRMEMNNYSGAQTNGRIDH